MAARNRKPTGNTPRKPASASRGLMLSMSPEERNALLGSYSHRMWPRTRQKIQTASEQSLWFTKNELSLILDELVMKLEMEPDAPRGVLASLRERVVEILEDDNPEAFGGEYLRGLDGGANTSPLFFQFRIELLNTRPAIWRRIQIADGPLSSLHYAIQGAFEWEECHLHQIEIGGLLFGPPPPKEFGDFGLPMEDETQVRIGQLLPSTGKQTVWLYTYDFGDDWVHEVLFEGCGPLTPRMKYPLCIEGRRAAPPEDCGGPWGFANILKALADPGKDRDEDLMEWLGPFDPEEFDVQRATKEMLAWARRHTRRR